MIVLSVYIMLYCIINGGMNLKKIINKKVLLFEILFFILSVSFSIVGIFFSITLKIDESQKIIILITSFFCSLICVVISLKFDKKEYLYKCVKCGYRFSYKEIKNRGITGSSGGRVSLYCPRCGIKENGIGTIIENKVD